MASRCYLEMLQWIPGLEKFMFHEPFSDWIRFSRKKSCLFWVDRSPYAGFRLLPCHFTMKEGERGPFFPKLRVRIKDNNSSPHGKFHRFLFPFSCKFPDLNFASYVLYIYLHSEPGLPVILQWWEAHPCTSSAPASAVPRMISLSFP